MAATTNGDDERSPYPAPIVHITTHNDAGRAVIHSSNAEPLEKYSGYNTSHKLLYTTHGLPMELNDEADIKRHNAVNAGADRLAIVRPNSTVCRIVEFAPGNQPLMHRTQSLDFGVVLEGSVIMELDDGHETVMNRGDTAVQRATMHAWKNNSDTEWARMLFVLQDCNPIIVGGQRYKEELSHGLSVFPPSGNDTEPVKA